MVHLNLCISMILALTSSFLVEFYREDEVRTRGTTAPDWLCRHVAVSVMLIETLIICRWRVRF
mgnify:FL=1